MGRVTRRARTRCTSSRRSSTPPTRCSRRKRRLPKRKKRRRRSSTRRTNRRSRTSVLLLALGLLALGPLLVLLFISLFPAAGLRCLPRPHGLGFRDALAAGRFKYNCLYI